MKCLVVIAHPLPDSLCHCLARAAIQTLVDSGHDVISTDLYLDKFSPSLTESERRSYYSPSFHADSVKEEISQLLSAEAIILVFPTWWFGFPAILKGWFDRVWAPGVAYDHASDLGPIQPRLRNLQRMLAITTLGSPWWVDRLMLWQPVKRILRIALLGACARRCRFKMLSLYKAESLTNEEVERFSSRIKNVLSRWL
ncbi:NAD(P)H dehydrogenase (quinone) [Desulfobulbus propionicus DSM 2032]|jgi:putative NADPH-quinone reductase|uniref:NAD(P)H dehydrogenase (Quinone) n=1 Tax=Desulfobulbus propionicus (strain ATCC 33891 / DSM 2032 / VKM B-1956 / 1pr3) TaxID=577650 RepID=A0A7U3YLG1_DESPD|nr:NAD(P)H-dependent oxidoreductase [Desulfobulbus propionicus]ADW17563.1 NAD(P)H dehydrogenase (quinone) [Desulfobulbus propionicus DSM 2032]